MTHHSTTESSSTTTMRVERGDVPRRYRGQTHKLIRMLTS
jgi:hypothetical protein